MAQGETPSVISKGVVVKGHLGGAEPLVVEGRLLGSVELRSQLTVEQGGHLEADVEVEAFNARGTVHGTVLARSRVTLEPGSLVQADLKAPRIAIQDGARFKGRIEMDFALPADL